MVKVLQQVLEWRRDYLTPDRVEKASKHERRKRTVWEITSVAISFGAVFAALTVLDVFIPSFPPTGVVGIAFAVAAIVTTLILDVLIVFPWGIERFDLTVPWQFREADADAE